MIDWKEAARHYRFHMRLADRQEGALKRRLWAEHNARVTVVNTLADILADIAYDVDDTDQAYCNVCRRNLVEEDGHGVGCLYVVALGVLAEAGKSANGRIEPTAITFTCHHCGEYFDEPIEAFFSTASVSVLAPTLCKDCGH